MGGFFGLCALAYFLNSKLGLPYSLTMPSSFGTGDIVIFIIMFYGLNGKLPFFMLQRWLGDK